MTKRRKQGLILLALSVPMMWWGFTNFMSGTTNSTALAIGTAIGCVFGAFSALSGLVMLSTKNSLGIWNPKEKLDKEKINQQNQKNFDEVLFEKTERTIDYISAQTELQKEIINKKQKVNEMAKAKDANIDDALEEFRVLGELIVQKEEGIKKDTLDVKTAIERRAVLKDNLAKDKTVKELLAMLQEVTE